MKVNFYVWEGKEEEYALTKSIEMTGTEVRTLLENNENGLVKEERWGDEKRYIYQQKAKIWAIGVV